MEGLGSRLGRASSRYGGQTPTVFNGRVRRWKKRWVHVPSSPSSSPSVTYQNPHSQSNGHNNNSNSSRLLLCRWTPISPASSAAAEPLSTEEPPRRKVRYTPVSVLEGKKKAVEKKVGDVEKTSEAGQSLATTDKMHGKASSDQVMEERTEDMDKNQYGLQDSNRNHLDLDLGLTGSGTNFDSLNQVKEAQMKKANSGRFWLG